MDGLNLVHHLSIDIPVQNRQETVVLFPERAVFWPSKNTLMVTDLHWGKPETFRTHGIPIPHGILEEDLNCLDSVIAKTGAERLIVLGDLIHGKLGMTEKLIARIAAWRHQQPIEIMLIRGNHDRHYKDLPPEWNIVTVEEKWTEGPFVFSHHPEPVPNLFVWAGHVHPTFVMHGKRDRVRLQCFHISKNIGVLPAFSLFTGGYNIHKQPGDRIIAIAETSLIEL